MIHNIRRNKKRKAKIMDCFFRKGYNRTILAYYSQAAKSAAHLPIMKTCKTLILACVGKCAAASSEAFVRRSLISSFDRNLSKQEAQPICKIHTGCASFLRLGRNCAALTGSAFLPRSAERVKASR